MMKDVVVVGGGVIGCSIALRLAREGLRVAIVERGRIGCEASRAAAGMLSPQAEASAPGPFLELSLRSRAMYPEFGELLRDLSGIDIEYRDEGTLCVAFEGEDPEGIARWASWQKAAELPLEELSAEDVARLEPEISRSAARAVLIPGDHQVNNRRLMDALDVAIHRTGVEVIEDAAVSSLTVEDGRAAGVVYRTDSVAAGAVVVAAGSWSSPLLQAAGVRIEVVPARGQMLALTGDRPAVRHVLHSNRVYIVPRNDGRVVVGATVEYAGFAKAVTAAGIHGLLGAALELVPALGEYDLVETWAGLRPDTSDHMPVLGPCGLAGFYVATGHFRNGILLAPVTADLIADCVLNEHAPQGLAPFTVERFVKRSVVGN